jgi:hypothetical protein
MLISVSYCDCCCVAAISAVSKDAMDTDTTTPLQQRLVSLGDELGVRPYVVSQQCSYTLTATCIVNCSMKQQLHARILHCYTALVLRSHCNNNSNTLATAAIAVTAAVTAPYC